jgi:flagellar transcriptional activator FlhD
MEQGRLAGASVADLRQEPDRDSLQQIEALNLSYLLLAQQLMRENEAEALFRLGLSREVGRVLASLTAPQMVALARSNQVLYRFRLDDSLLVSTLTATEPPHALQGMHAAIVMASQRD